jgi:hypothetical protein
MSQQMAIKVLVNKKTPPTNEVTFNFTDAVTAAPIVDLRIEVATIMGQLLARGASDRNGLFKAANIPDGEYGCRFEHPLYTTLQKLVSFPSGKVS